MSKWQATFLVSTVQTNTTGDFLDLLARDRSISLPTYCAYYQAANLQDGECFLIFSELASNDNESSFTTLSLKSSSHWVQKKPRRLLLLLMCDVIPLLLLLLLLPPSPGSCICRAAASFQRKQLESRSPSGEQLSATDQHIRATSIQYGLHTRIHFRVLAIILFMIMERQESLISKQTLHVMSCPSVVFKYLLKVFDPTLL